MMAVLSSKKKKQPVPSKKKLPMRVGYEPSDFVWFKPNKDPRVPALVLYGEDTEGFLIIYVKPTSKGDTGRRDVHYNKIEGRIK
jgi:hypothetical protein